MAYTIQNRETGAEQGTYESLVQAKRSARSLTTRTGDAHSVCEGSRVVAEASLEDSILSAELTAARLSIRARLATDAAERAEDERHAGIHAGLARALRGLGAVDRRAAFRGVRSKEIVAPMTIATCARCAPRA